MRNSIILVCLFLLAFVSCKTETTSSSTSTLNQEVTIEDEKMLLGIVDRNGFQLEEYKSWFDSTYQAYQPQDSILDLIRLKLQGLKIKVFMGTWCSDSQRDVPALYKILDQLDYDRSAMKMIALDRSKTLPEAELEGYEIEYIPTIVFSRAGKELGRIIETAEKTLEEDLLSIISQE